MDSGPQVARMLRYVCCQKRRDGDAMQLVRGRNGLFAAILVIVVLAAAFVVSCPDGVHLPISASVDAACTVMTHSSVAATVADAGSGLPALTLILAVAVALMAASGTASREFAVARADAPSRPPIDPLNGRMRL